MLYDKAVEEVKKIQEGNRTESDHIPMEVEVIGPQRNRRREKGTEVEIERSNWTEEGVKNYQEKWRRIIKRNEGWSCTQHETEGIWKEIKEKVKDAITKHKRKIIPWRLEKRDWFNKEWKGKKKELRRVLRELKKRRIDKEEYVRKRREYREWCKEQKKKHEEEEEERIRNIKSEADAWKYINKYRKKKTERISEKINIEEWKDHFVELLDDTQEKAVWQIESEEREDNKKGKEEIEDITKEELIETLKKLKKAKAPGGQNRE